MEIRKKIEKLDKDIRLIAVTKNVDVSLIKEAIALGVTDIGENRVQELTKKYDSLGSKINYHMIGHLQTNKVKYIIDKVCLIHSLDRLSLAKEINKRAKEHDIVMEVLVQVNISEEETKFGLKKKEVHNFIKEIGNYENLKVKGLMTMAPHYEQIEDTRWVFKNLKDLSKEIASKGYKNVSMDILSMGMTNDYNIAIEEGSTMVRVGTGIFGSRKY